MFQLIRRRWLAVIVITLMCLGAGAGWAALAAPKYRSAAMLDDPDLLIIAEEFVVDSGATSTMAMITRSGQELSIAVEADNATAALAVAEELAAAAQESSSTIRLMQAPSFPLSPFSPNLGRIALIAGLVGLVLGLGQAALIDRLLRVGAPEGDQPTPADLNVAPTATFFSGDEHGDEDGDEDGDGVSEPVGERPFDFTSAEPINYPLANSEAVPDTTSVAETAPADYPLANSEAVPDTTSVAETAPADYPLANSEAVPDTTSVAETAPADYPLANSEAVPDTTSVAETAPASYQPAAAAGAGLPEPIELAVRPVLRPARIQRRDDVKPRLVPFAKNAAGDDPANPPDSLTTPNDRD